MHNFFNLPAITSQTRPLYLKGLGLIALFAVTILPTLEYLYRVYFQMDLETHSLPVFLASMYFLGQANADLELKEDLNSPSAFFAVVGALVLYQISLMASINMLSAILSFVLLASLYQFFYGFSGLKKVAFPIFLLLFSLPITSILDIWIGFEIRLLGAKLAFFALYLLDIAKEVHGVHILLSENILRVDAACSGLKSLSVLMIMNLIIGRLFFTDHWGKRAVLVGAGIVISGLANSIRIVVVGVIAHHWGLKTAEGVLHDWSGIIIYSFSLLAVGVVYGILEKK